MKKALVFILLLFCCPAFALETEHIKGTILPEVILNRAEDTDYVYISILARTGPANESNSTAGFSALIASMLLSETKNKSAAEMEEVFYRLNGSMNITTTLDYTEIRLITVRKSLDRAMRIIGECLCEPRFSPEALEKNRENAFAGMVREADTPFQQTYDRLRFNIYGTSPYRRSVFGSAGAVKKATPKQLYRFFNENFCPRQLILAVTGNVTAKELKKAVDNSFFRTLPSPERRSLHKYSETIDKSRRASGVQHADSETYYMMGFLAPAYDEEDRAPMTVISGILGAGKAGRLFRDLRQKHGWGYYTGCRYPQLLRQSHIYIYVSTAIGTPDEARDIILGLTESLKTEPVSREELDRAVEYLITQEEIERQDYAALTHKTAEEALFGESFREKAEKLRKVEPADIMRCANKYFTNYQESVSVPEEK